MKKNKEVKRTSFAILFGLFIELLIKALVTLITTSISIYAVSHLSPIALNDFYRSPSIYLLNIITISLSFGSLIVAGVIAGYMTKNNGVLCGIIIGMVNIIIMLLIVLLPLLLPRIFYGDLYANPVLKQKSMIALLNTLRGIPLVFILSIFGGFMGSKIVKNK